MPKAFENLSKDKLLYVFNYGDLDGVEMSNYHGGVYRSVL